MSVAKMYCGCIFEINFTICQFENFESKLPIKLTFCTSYEIELPPTSLDKIKYFYQQFILSQ